MSMITERLDTALTDMTWDVAQQSFSKWCAEHRFSYSGGKPDPALLLSWIAHSANSHGLISAEDFMRAYECVERFINNKFSSKLAAAFSIFQRG